MFPRPIRVLLFPLLAVQLLHAAARIEQLSPTSWLIGNQFVERVISFSPHNGLETESLRYSVTGRDFLISGHGHNDGAGEFSFDENNHALTGAHSFKLRGFHAASLAGGKLLQVDLTGVNQELEVSVFYAVYDEQPAVRKWLTVTNRTPKSVSLSHLCFETLSAGPGTASELRVSGGYGSTPRELFFTGRVSDPAVFIRNATTGEGFAIVNEAPGYLKRTEVGSGWSERFLVMYDTDLFPFGRTLAPGETFESARCSLIFFADNHGLNDSRWVVPSYAANILTRRTSTAQPPWIFNTWEPFLRNINQETVKELAPIARQMGLDIFTIDDGWQAEYGANDWDRTRFPDGYSGTKAILDANHLRLGLWVPLAAISTKAPDYRAHPDWVCRDASGSPKFTQTAAGQQAVMCLGSGYRELALHRLNDLVEQFHPAYIKVDLTTVFNAYGEQPGCYATNHSHHNWPESLTQIYAALQFIGEQLHQTHPEVLVDYTFELWGEKHLIDPGLLRAADLDWLSNVNDTEAGSGGPLNARMLLYTRAASIPVETMLIGNLRAPTPDIEEHFATAIGSGPLFLGDLRALSPQQRAWYAAKIDWFKTLRSRFQLNDSFFPLGSWRQPNAASWDGFARFSQTGGGIVVLFRNKSAAGTAQIQFPAPPGASYDAKSIFTGQVIGQVSAADLTNGWSVKFSADHEVEVLELARSNAQ